MCVCVRHVNERVLGATTNKNILHNYGTCRFIYTLISGGREKTHFRTTVNDNALDEKHKKTQHNTNINININVNTITGTRAHTDTNVNGRHKRT